MDNRNLYEWYHTLSVNKKDAVELAALQRDMLLPLINEEKNAFIKAEYGRLERIMGAEYTEGGETRVFHPLPESRRNDNSAYGRPEELSLAELALLPQLIHKVERLGTVSTMQLIQCYPQDIARLQLLADMYEDIMLGVNCTESEIKALLDGHAEYLFFKQGDQVRIIK